MIITLKKNRNQTYIAKSYKDIVPLLLVGLKRINKQTNYEDLLSTSLSIPSSSNKCLSLISEIMGDQIVDHFVIFIKGNFSVGLANALF